MGPPTSFKCDGRDPVRWWDLEIVMGGFCSLQLRVMEKKNRQQHKRNETVFPLRGVQLTI